MDKIKTKRINGDKRERLGLTLGIHDKEGKELCVGDEIEYFGERCIILFNKTYKKYQAMIMSSCWYGDKNKYNEDSYGKAYDLHMDNGARMEIKKVA